MPASVKKLVFVARNTPPVMMTPLRTILDPEPLEQQQELPVAKITLTLKALAEARTALLDQTNSAAII